MSNEPEASIPTITEPLPPEIAALIDGVFAAVRFYLIGRRLDKCGADVNLTEKTISYDPRKMLGAPPD